MPNYLSLAAIKLIEAQVDKLFARAKLRYLGPEAVDRQMDKRIYFGYRPEWSLKGLYHSAAREESAIPSKEVMDALVRNASNYLDAYRSRTKASVVKKVTAFLREAELSGVKTDVETVLGGELAAVWAKTSTDVKRLIDTENTGARNMGTLEGIVGVNTAEGIEDPVVFWVVVRDDHTCDECRRLHLLPDGITPRLWKLSEVKHGYGKKGDQFPVLGDQHPNGRCTLATLLPGYGFNAGGMVKFMSLGHDEYKAQNP